MHSLLETYLSEVEATLSALPAPSGARKSFARCGRTWRMPIIVNREIGPV